jgi:hypothetical protein
MRKKMLFVFGPESAGTRGTTRFMIEHGGYWGTDEHIQPLDDFIYGRIPIDVIVPDKIEKVVFRRSVPHAGNYSDLNRIDTQFLNAGYSTKWLVVVRDLAEIVRSKISRQHAADQTDAWMQTVYQYNFIFEKIANKTNGVYFFPYTLYINNPQQTIDILKSFKIF